MGHWDEFAAREPYFAVLTQPRFLRQQFDEATEAEFFRSGEQYVYDLVLTLSRVAPRFIPRSVLEYGCGVGRLLIPLARAYDNVTGVDISPSMLRHARAHLDRAELPSVELMDTEAFAGDDRTFDLVNCFLLLQRLRPAEGLALLQRLARRVREGGVGVFHVPYRNEASAGVKLTRGLRARVPGANRLFNVARRQAADMPLIESHAYDLGEVLALLKENGFEDPQLHFTGHGDLEGVVIYAARRNRPGVTAAAATAGSPPQEPPSEVVPADSAAPHTVDAKKMIAETSIERLNSIAESYFSSLTSWEHHLAKPFASPDEAPQLMISLGVVLQGLRVLPGMTVLEYGAGSGWLSRYLTQLGCKVILLDVSATALEIARELYRRQPVIGERPAPEFLVFDGRKIALPDGSVDRVLCFDAFHHAPNPEAVIAEFGRVLKAGGVAGFAEPGPNHSKAPQSQYEMRTYGVLENDVDMHAIWGAARMAGFSDLRLAAYNIPPFHVTLDQYENILASGEMYGRWAESTLAFLRDVRMFFLQRSGREEADSRRASDLRALIDATISPELEAHVVARNFGAARWLPASAGLGGVSIGCHLYDTSGKLLSLDWAWIPIEQTVAPGEEVTLDATLPKLEPGRYLIELDCVANHVAWFAQTGSTPARVTVDVP
jgi:SAM-dependent methyltransferase